MKVAILLAFTGAVAHGAAVFKGKLVRNEIGGAPVVGASINASGASPRVSGNPHGDFVLEFRFKNPGDRVSLKVVMTGMVVVNWVQLEVTLPADADANELTLILARETDREEMARRFFRLRSIEAIEASYRRLIEEGKQDRAQLQRQLDQAKAAAASAAEELAKLRPWQASALYEDAMRLFALGKIDEALQALDEAKLRRLSQEARERKEQAEKQLAEATRSWLLRGKLLTTKFRFAEAEAAYGEAVKASPEDFNACFEQAYFFAALNLYNSAVQAYARCLALARAKADPASVAVMLNNLGNLHRNQNRMEQAGKEYEEALDISRRLARGDADAYLSYVAQTLNNLGILHRQESQMEEAQKAYKEALEIRRRLARANPDTYLPDLAQTLNNLGNLHRNQNRTEEAQKAYEQALEIRRQLARTNPDTFLPEIAGTLNNLGLLLSDQNRMEEARKDLEEALNIYRRLARVNPDIYLPYVGRVLGGVGRMHIASHEDSEARLDLTEALQIFQKFAAKDQAQYQPYVDAVNADLAKVRQ
jgi:tetratricopeptide (TPR) repeat protein